MGRHRRNRRSPRLLRTVLVPAAAVLAALAMTVAALAGAGRSTPRADTGSTVAPVTPSPAPARASRARRRTALRSRITEDRVPRERARRRSKDRVVASGVCEASFYVSGQSTASGTEFDPDGLTAAHRTLPMGTRVRVINITNHRSVIVRINDRGPFVPGRCLDLSTAAMRAVGGVLSGVIPVRYEVLAAV